MSIRWGKAINSFVSLPEIAEDGFDCVQPNVFYLMSLSNEQFSQSKEQVLRSNLVPEVCSSPLPPDAYVSQRGFNIYVWTEYLKKAVKRAAELGCKKIAWSNGRARVIPLEGDIGGVKEQVLQFLYMLCEIAETFGITVLVEPLGPARTNFLNTMQEVEVYLPLVGKENISSLISLRELSEIGLELEDLSTYSNLISHVQVENPDIKVGDKVTPCVDDRYDYKAFLEELRKIGYSEVITLPEDSDSSTLSFLRSLWAKHN